jgi:hypothetical protein
MRTAEEVMMRCKFIHNRPNIIQLVDKSSSPTATYDMVMDAIGRDEVAKAARWLGVLRRDYPDHYTEITRNTFSHVQRNTEKKVKRNDRHQK